MTRLLYAIHHLQLNRVDQLLFMFNHNSMDPGKQVWLLQWFLRSGALARKLFYFGDK